MAGHLLFNSGSNESSLALQFKWLDNTFKNFVFTVLSRSSKVLIYAAYYQAIEIIFFCKIAFLLFMTFLEIKTCVCVQEQTFLLQLVHWFLRISFYIWCIFKFICLNTFLFFRQQNNFLFLKRKSSVPCYNIVFYQANNVVFV